MERPWINGPWHNIGHSILGRRTKAVITGGGAGRDLQTCGADGLLKPLHETPTGRLILSSPDMAEALAKAFDFMAQFEGDDDYGDDADPIIEELRNLLVSLGHPEVISHLKEISHPSVAHLAPVRETDRPELRYEPSEHYQVARNVFLHAEELR